MNWLGLSARSLVGIILGVIAGLALFSFVWPNVVVVGASTGLGCALLAEDRSALRGVSVVTVATWAAAIADTHRIGVAALQLSTTLTGSRWAAYLGCVGCAFFLGGWSVRRSAAVRPAGT